MRRFIRNSSEKFVPRRRLAKIVAAAQRRGKTVVFTNGCFDLLHAGHVKLLKQAKALGDVLVVALNSDSSVRRLKGRGRPLANEKSRVEVMAALECVDHVTVFSEDTPREILQELKPQVLVKGGDYSLDQIVGREFVKRVARIPLKKGFSTSALVKRIVALYGR